MRSCVAGVGLDQVTPWKDVTPEVAHVPTAARLNHHELQARMRPVQRVGCIGIETGISQIQRGSCWPVGPSRLMLIAVSRSPRRRPS
ncbi:hypothetical protein Bcen2424_3832 [Burkholderia cenocepacia HI2424]|nr:hypothetical protein Bcen2424_3832 [Burkholderia cenocepacia HI2424]